MKKPQLCLALSVSIALLQANLLPAQAQNASPTIWQKLAGVAESKPAAANKTRTVVSKAPATRQSVSAATVGGAAGHAMLFMKKESGSAATGAPAAALTIHPSLPVEPVELAAAPEKREQPTLVAMNDTATKLPATQESSTQLVAQLAPDQIVAQGPTASTPIPPVVSGAVELEEFKPSNVIDLKVSQSRTFKLRNKIVRTSISDPSIAEPVVVAENQLVLLGKSPGGATLVIWDDAGNSMAVDLKVSRDYSQLQAMLREIDPRIIVKPFSVGGGDRVVLMGDVDHPESVIRAFSAANSFMDDRGMKIIAANSRLLEPRIGEQGTGAGATTGGLIGRLSDIATADKYVYFANLNNNVSRAQLMVSEGGRVTSVVRVRKVPLIVLHCAFLEMNTASVRELGVQLGVTFTSESFAFGIGGSNNNGTTANAGAPFFLTTFPGTNGITGQFAPTAGGLPSGQAIGFNLITPPFQTTPVPFIQPPANSANFGATSSPVGFQTANIIQNVIPGTQQVQTTPISAIGQGVFNVSPALVAQSFLFNAPAATQFSPLGLANMFTAASNFRSGDTKRWSINPSFQGLITHSRARVLSEPTLVTVSGERAAFLAGGEIPTPTQVATAGAALPGVQFEPFGIRLNMIPVLLENGSINLEVSPEERLVSNALASNFGGLTVTPIPGFITRKTQTIVELKPGQELFISGLISANHGRELVKTPLLGEVPVLGALYRSKAFAKNESELVISVRPEVILPGNPGQLKLPEEISRVEGVRDTNLLQVEPTIVDERYMTTGRAERSTRVGNVLPPGSPVPDSQ